MLKKLFLLIFTFLLTFTIVSCKKEDPYAGPYGKRIKEDLTSTHILDDNYRNYYEIFVRSFNDSDFDGVGDLNGVTAKLDYLKDLGYTGIWLMPINLSPTYHKYDVTDYYKVDPKYGTNDDLKNLIDECHKRGIKLIIDLVLNHSSADNQYFIKACAAYNKYKKGLTLTEEENKFKDFYVFYDTKAQVPAGITAYVAPGYDFYYEGNFSSNMPEFNCNSQAVKDEFKNIIKFYLDMGIDGFRLDAVKYFYFNNDKKCIDFLNQINTWTKEINPKAYIVGECWSGTSTIKNYYNSGCDSFFNFSQSVSYAATSGVINGTNPYGRGINTYYNALLSNIDIAGENGIPAPFLDNHDMPRYTYAYNARKHKFTFALLAMMNGTIFSYYGDEVGMSGSNTEGKPDQNVRIPIKWGDFTTPDCSNLSGVTEAVYTYPAVFEQLEDSNSILNYYKKVLLIRNQNPEIARGSIKLIEKDKEERQILFISKTYNNEEIGILFNFSETDNLNIDIRTYGYTKVTGQIVIDSSYYVGEQKDGSITLPPYSIVILRK